MKCVHYLPDAIGHMIWKKKKKKKKEKNSLRPAAISIEIMNFKDDTM